MVALRRQYNPKLTSIVTLASASICGIANVMEPSELEGRVPALGVSLVRRGCLDDQVLMHELGHNLGAHHDPANAPPPAEALFPYTYGHYELGVWRTIMSYSSECGGDVGCPRIDHISNPQVSFNGQPTGIAEQRDNARLMQQSRVRFGASAPTATPEPPCKSSASRLCLMRNRFRLDVAWRNQFNGTSGVGRSSPRTDNAGFFSFGDPSNLELMVKMLDFGDVVKVFWGQLTNLGYELTITDTTTGRSQVYSNTPGDCGGIDQGAFGAAPDKGVDLAGATVAPLLAPPKAGCKNGKNELCLSNRFRVAVAWRNPGNATSGAGFAVPFSKLTGAFHFGDATNIELMTKVIDHGGGRVDFFWGALSDLEYTITATDTQTGEVKTYTNAAGHYCGGLVVDAF
jgi:hypothetical protein